MAVPAASRNRPTDPPPVRPHRRRSRAQVGERVALVAVLLVAGALVLPPLTFMIWTSLTPHGHYGPGGPLSFGAYASLLRVPTLGLLVRDTMVFGLGSTAFGTALGTAMAWLVERTNAPGKAFTYAATFLGFAVPGILRVIGWVLLTGPGVGILGVHLSSQALESMGGMVFVEGLFWAPVAFLLMVGPFRSLDPSLEEAASVAGANAWQTTSRITARLLLPSLLSVVLLTFIRTIQAFEVPLLLGVPGNVDVMTAHIYLQIQEASTPNYAQASAFGGLLLAFLSLVLLLYGRVTRQSSRYQTVTGKGFRPRTADLGAWRWLGTAFFLGVFLLQAVPIAYLLLASFLPSLGLSGPAWQHLTLANYSGLSDYPGLVNSVTNSLIVALISATAAVVLAICSSWLMVRARVRGRWVADLLIGLPLVYPGIVMSLAVLVFYLRVPLPIYGSIWIFVIAYVAAFTPYAVRYTHPSMIQIHRDLEDIAYVSGARWLTAFRRVLAPLLMPALTGAWIFIFLISVRELSIAALLYTTSSPVVATQLLDMWANGNVNQLSAFGAVIAVVSIAVAVVAYRFSRRFGVQV